MAIKDAHDPRLFQHYAKLADDGTVLAIVEVAVGSAAPSGATIDVTDLVPADFSAVQVDPAVVEALTNAKTALVAAQDAHADAEQDVQAAVAAALAPAPMDVGKVTNAIPS